ncbi:MAG: TRAP transporter TatT component family protein, partial [Polyangiales bacterium]
MLDRSSPARTRWSRLLGAAFALTVSLAPSGCIKKMMIDGQIDGTVEGSEAMNGTADYEVARAASSAGLAQFEGMHLLDPGYKPGFFLLVKGYVSYASGFVEDDMEVAILEGKDDLAEYHKARAKSLYTRAVGFGTQWLESQHEGFSAAEKTGAEDKMVAYVKQFDDKDDAEMLFWTGYAWMARVDVTKETALLGTLYVGKTMVARAVELQDDIEHGLGHVILGSYEARTGFATLGPDVFASSRKHFDRALAITGGKLLIPKVQIARTYICRGDDQTPGRGQSFAGYVKTMQEVLDADDALPDMRLLNAIAKRKARRYLSKKYIT